MTDPLLQRTWPYPSNELYPAEFLYPGYFQGDTIDQTNVPPIPEIRDEDFPFAVSAVLEVESQDLGFTTISDADGPRGASSASGTDTSVGPKTWINPSKALVQDSDGAAAALGAGAVDPGPPVPGGEGPRNVSIFGGLVSNPNSGSRVWHDPGNAQSDNAQYAWATTASGSPTHFLQCQGYRFSIPSNATITGIQVDVKRYTPTVAPTGPNPPADEYRVSLLKNNTQVGVNRAALNRLPTSPGWVSFGNGSDNWGVPWSPADINSDGFGVIYQAIGVFATESQPSWVYVDNVRISVWYTTPGTSGTPPVTEASAFLKLSQFGFSVPSDAKVEGIRADVRRSGYGTVHDWVIKLTKGGTATGADRRRPDQWPADYGFQTYGGPTDKWGTTWTPAEINANGFGIAISAVAAGAIAGVDYVRIFVYWSIPGSSEVSVAAAPAVRFGPDEAETGRVVTSLSFQTEMPGGYSAGSMTVGVDEFFNAQLYDRASVTVYEYHTGRVLYEGRVTGIQDTGTDVTFQMEGWANHLKDNKTARWIPYDRDFSSWTGMSVEQKLNAVTSGSNPIDGSVTSDPATGEPAMELTADSPWGDALPNSAAIYDAAGITLGGIDFAWKQSGNFPMEPAWFHWFAWLMADLVPSDYDLSPDLTAAGPGHGTLNASVGSSSPARRIYAMVDFFIFSQINPFDGVHYSLFWTLLAPFSDHGLPLQGSVANPSQGRGLLVHDMVRYIAEHWADRLNIGDLEQQTFVVPHSEFKTPSAPMDQIESLVLFGGNSFYPLDWFVWEDRRLSLASPENHGNVWIIRKEDGHDVPGAGSDSQDMVNGVWVNWDDGSGTIRSVGPPGSGADFESTDLIDLDPDNPVNRDGGDHWETADAGVLGSREAAVRIGQVIMADRNRREWRGDIVLTTMVRDMTGNLEAPGFVHSGDYIVVADDEDTRPRRVVNTSFDGARSVSCSIGAPPDRLDTLLARVDVVLVGRTG